VLTSLALLEVWQCCSAPRKHACQSDRNDPDPILQSVGARSAFDQDAGVAEPHLDVAEMRQSRLDQCLNLQGTIRPRDRRNALADRV